MSSLCLSVPLHLMEIIKSTTVTKIKFSHLPLSLLLPLKQSEAWPTISQNLVYILLLVTVTHYSLPFPCYVFISNICLSEDTKKSSVLGQFCDSPILLNP